MGGSVEYVWDCELPGLFRVGVGTVSFGVQKLDADRGGKFVDAV